ncbi:MAG: hypothetical protein ACJ0RN_02285 [Candidatus Neomarinimicrobiota bacterium]
MDNIKKIILSDLVINDMVFLPKDDLQYPWEWIGNINHFFKDIKSSQSSFKNVIINESNGPVFIAGSAKVEPFTVINGPVFIGKNCLVKSHSNISNSIINHDCKVKGEIHTSIFQPFSNKAHEGFIGHSFIGSWVNLGAGTTTSNLKNNYSDVSIRWNKSLVNTNSIFFGSIIGDHVKTAIGTNLNTGTIIEMGSNIVSQSFPKRHIPCFSFYYKEKISKINFDDFKKTAKVAMKRRNIDFSSYEDKLLAVYKKD